MKKTIKNISLMLLLVVSILPLSGCGRKSASTKTMDNAFDALSELKIEYHEVEYSEEYINAMTKGFEESEQQKYKDEIAKEKTYEITISNPTDHYYNYAPVGFIFDKETLTQEDLESKEYSMIIIPLTLAPGDENVFNLTPDEEINNGDEITIAPYLLPFTESAIGTDVKDSYGASKKNSSSDSKDDNKDKKNNDKDNDKDKDSSDSVKNTTVIKSDNSKKDSKDSSKDNNKDSDKDSSDESSLDKKYIQAYISDEKSSQVVYPGDVEFGKPQKKEERELNGFQAAGYTTEITNNGEATLKVSRSSSAANSIMFGVLIVDGDTINGVSLSRSEKDLKLKEGESGELLTVTLAASVTEPKLIFNGYGPAKGASDSKDSDKDNSKDSDKNKDNSKDSDKNKDKKSK